MPLLRYLAILGIPVYAGFILVATQVFGMRVHSWLFIVLLYPFAVLVAWLRARQRRMLWRPGLTWEESGELEVTKPVRKLAWWDKLLTLVLIAGLGVATYLVITANLASR